MIPKVLHQFWDKPALRDRHTAWVHSFDEYNPGWEHAIWTPDMIVRNADFAPIIPMIRDPLMPSTIKSDLFRHQVLYVHGGFYADMDCECLRSLDPLCTGESTGDSRVAPYVIGFEQEEDSRIQPAFCGTHFIGSVPGHDVSQTAVTEFVENLNRHYDGPRVKFMDCWDMLYTSGPQALTMILKRWGIIPLPQDCFSPAAYLPRPATADLLALDGPAYVFHHFDGLKPDGWTQQRDFLTK